MRFWKTEIPEVEEVPSGHRKVDPAAAEKIYQDSFLGGTGYTKNDAVAGVQVRSSAPGSVFKSVQNLGNEQILNVKAAKNAKYDRFRPVKMVTFILLFTCSLLNTMKGVPLQMQLLGYLFTAAFFVAADAIGAFERTLAKQARLIVAFLICLVIVFVVNPNFEVFLVFLISGLFGALIIKLLNGRWLASENWLMSAEVQRALLNNPGHNGKAAAEAWNGHGARETRTILFEMGLSAFDDVLESLKPVYIVAYLHGAAKNDELAKKLRKMEKDLVLADNTIENLEDQIGQLQAEIADMDTSSCCSEVEAERWKRLYEKSKDENEKLKRTNEELVAALPDPAAVVAEKVVQFKKESTKETILELVASGISYREVAKMVGCSAATISNIVKESKKEVAAV